MKFTSLRDLFKKKKNCNLNQNQLQKVNSWYIFVYVSFILELEFLFLNRWKTVEIFQTIHESLSLICIEFGVIFQIIFYSVLCVIVATRMGSWFQQQKQCVEINSDGVAKLKKQQEFSFSIAGLFQKTPDITRCFGSWKNCVSWNCTAWVW